MSEQTNVANDSVIAKDAKFWSLVDQVNRSMINNQPIAAFLQFNELKDHLTKNY